MPASPPPRNPGLDLLRAVAIAWVFIYHYGIFVAATPGFGLPGQLGWVGVDLFFVLSGYLIGHQILAGTTRGEELSVPRFWARRALRTWPVFWVVLAAYLLWPDALGGRAPPPAWRFLTFTQNLGLQPGTAFSHAWSLCIEEQFYAVLPLAALLLWRPGMARWRGWLALAALVAGCTTLRALRWQALGDGAIGGPGQMTAIYYHSLCRVDEFVPGLALALLRHLHPAVWQRLMRHGQALLVAGLLAVAATLWLAAHRDDAGTPQRAAAMSTVGYPLLACAFALLVAAAHSPASLLQRVRVPGAATLALWSYPLYLSHKPIAHVLRGLLQPLALAPGMLLAVITVACLLGAWLLHRLVEAPALALRERWVPDHMRRPATPRPAPA